MPDLPASILVLIATRLGTCDATRLGVCGRLWYAKHKRERAAKPL